MSGQDDIENRDDTVSGAGNQHAPESDFESAFDELATAATSRSDGAGTTDEDLPPDGDDDAQGRDDHGGDGPDDDADGQAASGRAGNDDGQGQSDTGQQAQTSAAPSKDGADGKARGGDDKTRTTPDDDPIAQHRKTLPPEVTAAFDRILQENRSNRGRLSRQDRELQQMRTRIGRTPAGAAPGAGTPNGQGSGNKATGQKPVADALKKLREEYGEDVAGPLEAILTAQDNTIAELRGRLDGIQQNDDREFLQREENLLLQEVPDFYETIFNDPSDPTKGVKDAFKDWARQQPNHIQEAITRNGANVIDHREVADVVTRFKQHLGAAQQGNTSGSQSRPATGQPGTNHNASRRRQQLEAATGFQGKGGGPTGSSAPEDFESAFDHHAQKRMRQSA